MTSFTSNPFTWDTSSAKVQSAVTSLSLTNGSTGQTMDTSNFTNPVSLFIPRDDSKMVNFSRFNVRPMGNDEYIQYHSFHAISLNNSVHIQVKPLNKSINLEVFFSFNERPTLQKHEYNWTLPDFSSCVWRNISLTKIANVTEKNGTTISKTVQYLDEERYCDNDPYTAFVSNTRITQLGLYYIGEKKLIFP